MNNFQKICCIFTILFSYSTISHGVILDTRNNTLYGAFDVDINGVLYDVSFKDGTCVELYDGCDKGIDYPLTNQSNANDWTFADQAMSALLEQVFTGIFDSNPHFTNGCGNPLQCNIITPWFSNNLSGGLGVFTVTNLDDLENKQVNHLDNYGQGGLNGGITFDTSIVDLSKPENDYYVYAVWSQSSAVPVPAAVWLFSTGLIGLVGMRKKASKVITISA